MSNPESKKGLSRSKSVLKGAQAPLGVVWGYVPVKMRKTIVFVTGTSIVLLGLALVVLPGPFTIPLLILGFFVLGTEFAWAATALAAARKQMDKVGAFVKKKTFKRSDSGD